MEVFFLQICVATKNKHKFEEFQAMMGNSYDLLSLPVHVEEAPETGHSFQEIALQKARFYALHTQMAVLADDSGLVVPALGGKPGIYSARFAGKHGDDAANRQKLLMEMEAIPDERRQAYFVAAIVVVDANGNVMAASEGKVQGMILRKEQGNGGFGYDSLFYYPPLHHTFAELPPEFKNQHSHRTVALREILRQLKESSASL